MRFVYFLMFFIFLGLYQLGFSAFALKGTVRESVDGMPIPNAVLTMDGKTVLGRTSLDGDYLLWFDRDTVFGKKIWVLHPNYANTYFWIPWMQEVPDEKGIPSKMVTKQMDIEMGLELPAFKLNKRSNPWGHYQRSRYKPTDSVKVSLAFCPSGYVPTPNEIAIGGVYITPAQASEGKFTATLPLQEMYKASWIIVSAGRERVEIPISQTCPLLDYVVKLPPSPDPKPVGFTYFKYPATATEELAPPPIEELVEPFVEDVDAKISEMERVFNEAFYAALKGYKALPTQNLTVYTRLHPQDRSMGSFGLFLPDGKPLDDDWVKDAIREAWAEVQKTVRFLTPRETMVIFLGFEADKGLFGR